MCVLLTDVSLCVDIIKLIFQAHIQKCFINLYLLRVACGPVIFYLIIIKFTIVAADITLAVSLLSHLAILVSYKSLESF